MGSVTAASPGRPMAVAYRESELGGLIPKEHGIRPCLNRPWGEGGGRLIIKFVLPQEENVVGDLPVVYLAVGDGEGGRVGDSEHSDPFPLVVHIHLCLCVVCPHKGSPDLPVDTRPVYRDASVITSDVIGNRILH